MSKSRSKTVFLLNVLNINLEQLVDYFCEYESKNLKTYAGDSYDNFLVFKNPSTTEVKDSFD